MLHVEGAFSAFGGAGVEEYGVGCVEFMMHEAQQKQAHCEDVASRQRFLENQFAPPSPFLFSVFI